jgi:menaquinol-cytochrome c reductase iron-sulfur subunit
MNSPGGISRRGMFLKVAVLFNALVGVILAVPLVGYILSPLVQKRRSGSGSWVSLGSVGQFPPGETRLATFRNPVVNPWDGETADIPCWVRHTDARTFQVFAINCAHLWCPVHWFPQSNLFMCPCHGGVYYADGSRAAGPPERSLFEYSYKVDGDNLFIEAGAMPTPKRAANMRPGGSQCA